MLAAFAVLVATVVVLLFTAGEEAPTEARGDLTYLEGSVPNIVAEGSSQLVASIADITAADVASEGDALVFEASLEAPLPKRLKTSALQFRWEIAGEKASDWTLTVAMDKDIEASLFSDEGYGTGTVDGTFPGELLVDRKGIEVWLDPAEIADFPEEFEWSLATTLRAFRHEPDSPRVEDRFPDEGTENFDPWVWTTLNLFLLAPTQREKPPASRRLLKSRSSTWLFSPARGAAVGG